MPQGYDSDWDYYDDHCAPREEEAEYEAASWDFE